MSKPSLHAFRWSEKEFTLKEVITEYKHLLPFAILVTQGYSAQNDHVSCSTNEVFWLHDIIKQSWILLKDKRGKRYKVSAEYDTMVIPIKANGTEGKPVTFNQVFLREDYKCLKLCDPEYAVRDQETIHRIKNVPELRVIEKLQLDALVVHSIFTDELLEDGQCLPVIRHLPEGVIYPEYNLVPSDLPIKVSLGVSTNSANPDAMFFYIMADIKQIADSYCHDYLNYMKKTAEIELYDLEGLAMSRHGKANKRNEPTPLNHRKEPVALHKDINPHQRLKELRQFYDGKSSLQRQQRSGHRASAAKRFTTAEMLSWPSRMGLIDDEEEQPLCRPPPVRRAGHDEQVGTRITVMQPAWAKSSVNSTRQRASVAVTGFDSDRDFRPSQVAQPSSGRNRLSAVAEKSPSGLTLADIPEDINDFSVDDVINSLILLRLSEHADAMRSKQIDGKKLAKIPEEKLRKDFGFSSSGAKKLALFVKSRMVKNNVFELDSVRRKLPGNSYVTLYQ